MADHRQRKNQKTDKDNRRRPLFDEVWPVHSAGGWPQGISLDRGDIYEGNRCI